MTRPLILIITAIGSFSFLTGWSQNAPKDPKGTNALQNVPTQTLREKSSADLNKRIPATSQAKVAWSDAGFGFIASFTIDNVSYMSFYNGKGNYMETFTKLSWDDRVPPVVKMEFDNSAYNKDSVIGFWEGSDSRVKDYYLELEDPEGKSKNVWVDDNGKFSETPIVSGQ